MLDCALDFKVDIVTACSKSRDSNHIDGNCSNVPYDETFPTFTYVDEDQTYHAVKTNVAAVNNTVSLHDNVSATVTTHSDDAARSKPNAGNSVEVTWPADGAYYPGVIAEKQNGLQEIVYDDCDYKMLDFGGEVWL